MAKWDMDYIISDMATCGVFLFSSFLSLAVSEIGLLVYKVEIKSFDVCTCTSSLPLYRACISVIV